MSDTPGMIPPANDLPPDAEQDQTLPEFEETEEEVLEKRGAPPSFSSTIWPLIIGTALAFGATKLFDIFTSPHLHLQWMAQIVFPYVLLALKPEFRLYGDYTSQLPQYILWAQFPLEGLFTVFNLRRRMSVGAAIGLLVVIHLVGTFMLFMLSQH